MENERTEEERLAPPVPEVANSQPDKPAYTVVVKIPPESAPPPPEDVARWIRIVKEADVSYTVSGVTNSISIRPGNAFRIVPDPTGARIGKRAPIRPLDRSVIETLATELLSDGVAVEDS